MRILVINSGSSSIKFSMFETGHEVGAGEPVSVYEGEVGGVGTAKAAVRFVDAGGKDLRGDEVAVQAATPLEAIGLVVRLVTRDGLPGVEAVGYRVVHPGAKLDRHQRITEEVLRELEAAKEFAPLHDPEAVKIIREMMGRFAGVAHYACFDTVFHETMPEVAKRYPIAVAWRERGVRRYGFHGLSCESVVWQMRKAGEVPKRMVIAHLGSGCSVTAVVEGRSVDTTMGLTPTGGVVMGTRPGDLDPGLMLFLLRQEGATAESVEQMLNHEAGLKGLCGLNDMRAIREAAEKGDAAAVLAVDSFCRSVRKAVAGFAATAGMDALVFTGGIGEHDARTRSAVAAGVWGDGPVLDAAANEAKGDGVRRISGAGIGVFVVPAAEDLMIARHVARLSASE